MMELPRLDTVTSLSLNGRDMGLRDDSVDKELSGRLLQVVARGSLPTRREVKGGVPQGSVSGPKLFNIFVGYVDSGTECTLSKFTDHSLCGAANTLQGRDVILRDVPRLEGWARANLMMFNKEKHKVLCMGHGNPRHTCGLGGEVTKSTPGEKD